MSPTNDLTLIRTLAADEGRCVFFQAVISELHEHALDTDDLRDIIATELGENHCFKTRPTIKHYVGTYSDYFSIWVEECGCRMFLKILVCQDTHGDSCLVISSFKKDDRYET